MKQMYTANKEALVSEVQKQVHLAGIRTERRTVFGCRFALSIMSDNYIDIILGSLAKTDTSRVEASTGKLSTLYRGKRAQVLDALEGCFIHAFTEGVHMTLEGTFSTDDGPCRMPEDDVCPNEESREVHFPCNAKIKLYCAEERKADVLASSIAKGHGVLVKEDYYCTVLQGDIQEIFRTIEEICEAMSALPGHPALETTLSVNSPTAE